MDLQAAIEFVKANGNPVEQARLRVLLQEQTSVREALAELSTSQRQDGGWAPFWAPGASSVDATCYRLAQCEQLGVSGIDMVERAVAFLRARQKSDGSVREDEALARVAPPWARPGDEAASIYLTANAGYWMQYFGGTDKGLQGILRFLLAKVNREGYLPSFLHANWLAAGLLHALGKTDEAESMMSYLHGKLAELEASNLAWLANSLCVMGVLAEHPLIVDACDKLATLQRADGRWASEDGEWQDVHTTLESLRALRNFAPLCKSRPTTKEL